MRFHEYSKSSAVTGSPFVHVSPSRSVYVTVLPSSLVSKLSAAAPTGFRSLSSLTSGSMMLSRMFDDVVSVARPGSSDGGSVPQFTVITCSAASVPPSVVAPVPAASSSSPPQPAATRARLVTSSASHNQRVFVLIG